MTDMTLLYDVCKAIMFKAHTGQYRRDGTTPYSKHPLDAASMFDFIIDQCIMLLHDAVEDGKPNKVDLQYIQSEFERISPDGGLCYHSSYILTAVNILSHAEHDTYKMYIKRIKDYGFERYKIADIVCNLTDSPSDYQQQKYKRAMKQLLTSLKIPV